MGPSLAAALKLAAMSTVDPWEEASPQRRVALTVRFLLELALLAGAAALAVLLTTGGWRWVAAIAAMLVIAAVWGALLSPKAPVRLPSLAALAVEALLFLVVGIGLMLVGLGVPAAIGIAIWVCDRLALALLPR